MTSFANRLKWVIGNNSTNSFARKCNLSESAVRRYLTGGSEPTLQNLLSIASVGNVSVTWLATGSHTEKNSHSDPGNDFHLKYDPQNGLIVLPELVVNSDNNDYTLEASVSLGNVSLTPA
ncbi:helix-turn-helix domain-containing protein [Zophobihabitans entericus]|uniref:Helix-turn-helix transcriptional regulator n=1 Tax=Zophobihabitans entericus TaxID=1635327 RepID=A0A6G9IAU0_9GAMM|nr:helix-turn-helix transcriptional regulator [Zophobihabitans entericus]QIQ20939.1 helix-turn-helix transcriptional regulator [Zophobihabitans entericus]